MNKYKRFIIKLTDPWIISRHFADNIFVYVQWNDKSVRRSVNYVANFEVMLQNLLEGQRKVTKNP